MALFRIREVKFRQGDDQGVNVTALREYELDSAGASAVVEEVRRFLEIEILSLRAPQKIDFDALLVLDAKGVEVARFLVSDVWKRQADAVESGKTYAHWV
jgi:hypothetical protein